MPDPATVLWLSGAMAALLAACGGWAWLHTHNRIDVVASDASSKASSDELNRQRDHVEKIFERLGEVESTVNKIESQVSRFTADIESEKRTRKDSNKEIMSVLEKIRDKIGTRTGDHH